MAVLTETHTGPGDGAITVEREYDLNNRLIRVTVINGGAFAVSLVARQISNTRSRTLSCPAGQTATVTISTTSTQRLQGSYDVLRQRYDGVELRMAIGA